MRGVVILGVSLLFLFSGCDPETTTTPEQQTCDSTNCPGCCVGTECRTGYADDTCGSSGNQCSNCSVISQICDPTTRQCIVSCQPACSGKCAGASDGCGGLCQVNSCQGCCDGTQCNDGTYDAACGSGGGSCADCTQQAQTCSGGSCSGCSPDCSGKCIGASDGCGGTCTTNSCTGCCDGTECKAGDQIASCGINGSQCEDCTNFDGCTAGKCNTCSPNCTEKCAGESDGCGGSCPTTTCSGCGCWQGQNTCYPGTSDTTCGPYGQQCWPCPTGWSCLNQQCVEGTTNECDGKTGGTTSCTLNGVSGKCWDNQCCTGCYDETLKTCQTTASGSNTTCGTGGIKCEDCTANNEACVNYACSSSNDFCAGKQDFTACKDALQEDGRCIAGTCCTTCYYTDNGVNKCESPTTQDHCGDLGGACRACETWEKCTNGTCTADPNALYYVKAVAAKFDESVDWDHIIGLSPAPDPYACLAYDCNTLHHCTDPESDTYQPSWNQRFEWIPTYYQTLTTGTHCVRFRDSEGVGYETMGECKFSITDTDIKNGSKLISNCTDTQGKPYVFTIAFEPA